MVENYVLEIRSFIGEHLLVKFDEIKTMSLSPQRINLIIDAIMPPSEEFLNKKSSLFSFSCQKESDDAYICVFTGLNNRETLDAIEEALLIY